MDFQKTIFTIIVGIFSYLLNCISPLVIILVIFIVFDYVTGITVAILEKKFNKEDGVKGAIKKLFYLMIVTSAFLLDLAMVYITKDLQIIGYENIQGLFGTGITVYFVGNELLSLISNWEKLGIPVPNFFKQISKAVKNIAIKSLNGDVKSENGDDLDE